MLRRNAEQMAAVYDRLTAIPIGNCEPLIGETSRDAYFWMLTLQYGIHMSRASMNFFNDTVARLERGEHANPKDKENTDERSGS